MQPYKSTYTTGRKKHKTKQMKKKGKNNASRNTAKKYFCVNIPHVAISVDMSVKLLSQPLILFQLLLCYLVPTLHNN